MAGYLWGHEETKVLLGLWGDASVLEGTKANKQAFLRIAKEINEVGYERTRQQCQVQRRRQF